MNLTRLTYALAALTCILGIAQLWSGVGGPTWWRLFAALLILGLCYEWVRIRTRRLSIRPDIPDTLRLGRRERLQLNIDNSWHRSLHLQLVNGLPEVFESDRSTVRLQIAPGQRQQLEIVLRSTAIGEFSWHQLPLRVRGPLGLGWWTKQQNFGRVLRVVPDLLGARGSDMGLSSGGTRKAQRGIGQELHLLREYVAGDPRHTLDWKATARRRRLITRVYSEEQHVSVMLVLDVGRTSRTQVDGLNQLGHYINLCAKFAQHSVNSGDEVGLLAMGDDVRIALRPRGGAIAVRRIREALTQLKSEPVEIDLLSAALRVQNLLNQRSLIVLLTDLYGQTSTSALNESLGLWNRRHLPIVVGLVGQEVAAMAGQSASARPQVFQSLAARHYQQNLQHGSTAVRSLGGQSLVCGPAELQQRVFAQYEALKAKRLI